MCPTELQDFDNSIIAGKTYIYSTTKDPTITALSAFAGTIALGVGKDPAVKGKMWQKQNDGLTTSWTLISVGAMNYQGTWNANLNVPNLVTATPNKGDFWIVTVAGATNLGGITDWQVMDWAVYRGAGVWDKIDNSELVVSVNGQTGAVVLTTLPTMAGRNLYVDVNRTDVYPENGNITSPFKTIQGAINQIILNNDDILNPYNVIVQNGKYYENITVESLNIHRIKFTANGVVQIRPVANQAFKSLTNNSNIAQLHVQGFTFLAPVEITGANGSTAFNDVMFDDCNFVIGDGAQIGTLTLTCINNFSIRRAYFDVPAITINNVNYCVIDDSNIGCDLNVAMDSAANLPSQGFAGILVVNTSSLLGSPSFSITGPSKAYQFMTNASRIGASTSVVIIPLGLTVTGYNSFFRGTWTNNNILNLRNSNVQTLLGTAPVLIQPTSQIGNDSSVTGANTKEALDNLKATDERGKTICFSLDNGSSPITSGFKGFILVPSSFDLVAWSIAGDNVGVIEVDVWKCPYVGIPPTVANSIVNGHYITLAAQIGAKDEDITDWSDTHINQWDAVGFNINVAPIPTVKKINIVLKGS